MNRREAKHAADIVAYYREVAGSVRAELDEQHALLLHALCGGCASYDEAAWHSAILMLGSQAVRRPTVDRDTAGSSPARAASL